MKKNPDPVFTPATPEFDDVALRWVKSSEKKKNFALPDSKDVIKWHSIGSLIDIATVKSLHGFDRAVYLAVALRSALEVRPDKNYKIVPDTLLDKHLYPFIAEYEADTRNAEGLKSACYAHIRTVDLPESTALGRAALAFLDTSKARQHTILEWSPVGARIDTRRIDELPVNDQVSYLQNQLGAASRQQGMANGNLAGAVHQLSDPRSFLRLLEQDAHEAALWADTLELYTRVAKNAPAAKAA